MALGLEDLDRIQSDKQTDENLKDRVLRPWEGYDSLGNQTRTIAAREAVKKARQIVKKNESLVLEIKKDIIENNDFKTIKEVSIIQEISKKKGKTSIINFLREIIG